MASESNEWAEQGYVKLQRDTFLERLLGILLILALMSVFIVWSHAKGFRSRGGRHHPPKPELRAYLPWTIGATGMLLALRLLTDNYYLLDPTHRRVLYHFKFLGFRRVTPRHISGLCHGSGLSTVPINEALRAIPTARSRLSRKANRVE